MTISYETTPSASGAQIPFIKGLSEIAHRYDGYIFDLFGVLHNGVEPYPGTLNTLIKLKEQNKKTVLLSNTPKLSAHSSQDLAAMGITEDLYDRLITAGDATRVALQEKNDDFHAALGSSCWYIGPETMAHLLEGLDFKRVERAEDATFILNAMPGRDKSLIKDIDKGLDYAAKHDIPMICANPDLVVNIGDRQHECAGMLAKHYEEMGGRVAYHGKPYRQVYNMALEALGLLDKTKILAVGDSIRTDIQGAHNFEINSIFNLVGIHREEVLMDNSDQEIDLDKVMLVLKNQPFQPTAVMAGLQW